MNCLSGRTFEELSCCEGSWILKGRERGSGQHCLRKVSQSELSLVSKALRKLRFINHLPESVLLISQVLQCTIDFREQSEIL